MDNVVSLDQERARRNPRVLTQAEAEADWRYTAFTDATGIQYYPTLLTEDELCAGAASDAWSGRGCPCLPPDSPDPQCPIVGHFYGDVDDAESARAQHPAGKGR